MVYTLCDLFYCTVSIVSVTIFDTVVCAMFSDGAAPIALSRAPFFVAPCVRRSCICFRVGGPTVYALCNLFYCTVSTVSATVFDTVMCAMFSDNGVLLRGSGGFNGVNGGSTGRSPVLRPVRSPWHQDLFPCFNRHFSGKRAGTPELSIVVPPQHAPRTVRVLHPTHRPRAVH